MSTAPVLVVHGGAGVPADLPADLAAAARAGLKASLAAGMACLLAGGTALDAVQAAVEVMEDDPTFNAGIGGALTTAGHVEHDAALMRGADGHGGAVGAIRRIRHPIALAREVLEHSPHVLLVGEGAEAFAQRCGFALEDPALFITERRQQALQRVLAGLPKHAPISEQDAHGTVGAVALDQAGHLAAATSTGGRTGKWPGRVGDTPLLGAGTYANDATAAISCTGNGEYFMRLVTAHALSARMAFGSASLQDAATAAVADLGAAGGTGGLIAVGRDGSVALPYNTAGMYRGVARADGSIEIAI